MIAGPLLQLTILIQVNIFQSVIMGDNVVRIGTFTDIQDSPVIAIDIDDSRTPSLPVHIDMLCHGALGNGITHIDIVTIIACITEYYRLIVGKTRTLIGEELIVHIFLTKTLMGIDCHRLSGSLSRPGTSNTGLAELVQL